MILWFVFGCIVNDRENVNHVPALSPPFGSGEPPGLLGPAAHVAYAYEAPVELM